MAGMTEQDVLKFADELEKGILGELSCLRAAMREVTTDEQRAQVASDVCDLIEGHASIGLRHALAVQVSR